MESKGGIIIAILCFAFFIFMLILVSNFMKNNCIDSCHKEGIAFKSYAMTGTESGCYCNQSKSYETIKTVDTGLCKMSSGECEVLE